MITRMPWLAALRAYSAVRSGERWADVTSISYAIPNSSRAFPASRMISRSESLPITIETSGLLINSFFLLPSVGLKNLDPKRTGDDHDPELRLLQRSGSDISAIVRAVETDACARLIGALYRCIQIRRSSRNSQHTPSGGVERAFAFRCSGVKHLYAFQLSGPVEPDNFLARFVGSGITA